MSILFIKHFFLGFMVSEIPIVNVRIRALSPIGIYISYLASE